MVRRCSPIKYRCRSQKAIVANLLQSPVRSDNVFCCGCFNTSMGLCVVEGGGEGAAGKLNGIYSLNLQAELNKPNICKSLL